METFLNAFRDAYGALARCRARWDDAQGASVALLGTAVNAFEQRMGAVDARVTQLRTNIREGEQNVRMDHGAKADQFAQELKELD